MELLRFTVALSPSVHGYTALGQWAGKLLQYTAALPGGSGLRNSCGTPRHYVGALGSEILAVHRHTGEEQWAVELLRYIAAELGSSGRRISSNTLPYRLGAMGSGSLAMRGPASWRDGESCPGGGHCLKSGTLAMHFHTPWGQWAVELLSCTATLLTGSGEEEEEEERLPRSHVR